MNRAVGLLVAGRKREGGRGDVSLSDGLVDQLRQSGWTPSELGSVRKWFAYTANQLVSLVSERAGTNSIAS